MGVAVSDERIDVTQLGADFVLASSLQGIRRARETAHVGFAHLVHYVEGRDFEGSERVEAALRNDLSLRRTFKQLLSRRSVAALPQEAQADDGARVSQREGEGFSVLFRPSKANPDQLYVILRVFPDFGAAEGKAFMLVAELDDEVTRVRFPELLDGQSQCILPIDHAPLAALQAPKSHISLVSLS